MTKLHDLAVEHYQSERIPNPYPGGDLSWRQYQAVRNAMVLTCRRHGPTGPMGEFPLHKNSADIMDWEPGDSNPVYFIVDDQYNDEMYLFMEFVASAGCTGTWLEDVTATLSHFPGWGIGINSLESCYVLIFADRLLVTGPAFSLCRNAEQVINAIRQSCL